ncbi:hypothetical protein NBT05_03515 [Aquimarina sp. ERC-38]|uniref:c-type cytochrome domain-containing protein n=1 Tax=Aquimarina sp. ERC-38 TaxID=2949996 RepID=UPI0022481FBC|nr:c-type cytochrome domain-containing protein [Aquimarina sp. ERC-38]UZO81549.1 hypothetical protein NBT05_03515 [Aquimarina sp. ERC-38]
MKRKTLLKITLLLGIILIGSCQHDPVFTEVTDPNMTDPDITDENGRICDSDTIYFSNQVFPILMGSCATTGCHDSNTARAGVNLTSYENIFETGRIEPFDLNRSNLYRVITETDLSFVMPPGNPLPQDQIDIIGKWIEQGALNNSCDN